MTLRSPDDTNTLRRSVKAALQQGKDEGVLFRTEAFVRENATPEGLLVTPGPVIGPGTTPAIARRLLAIVAPDLLAMLPTRGTVKEELQASRALRRLLDDAAQRA